MPTTAARTGMASSVARASSTAMHSSSALTAALPSPLGRKSSATMVPARSASAPWQRVPPRSTAMTPPGGPTNRRMVGVLPRTAAAPGSSAISPAVSSRLTMRLTEAADRLSSVPISRLVACPRDLMASSTRNVFSSAMLPMSIPAVSRDPAAPGGSP